MTNIIHLKQSITRAIDTMFYLYFDTLKLILHFYGILILINIDWYSYDCQDNFFPICVHLLFWSFTLYPKTKLNRRCFICPLYWINCNRHPRKCNTLFQLEQQYFKNSKKKTNITFFCIYWKYLSSLKIKNY